MKILNESRVRTRRNESLISEDRQWVESLVEDAIRNDYTGRYDADEISIEELAEKYAFITDYVVYDDSRWGYALNPSVFSADGWVGDAWNDFFKSDEYAQDIIYYDHDKGVYSGHFYIDTAYVVFGFLDRLPEYAKKQDEVYNAASEMADETEEEYIDRLGKYLSGLFDVKTDTNAIYSQITDEERGYPMYIQDCLGIDSSDRLVYVDPDYREEVIQAYINAQAPEVRRRIHGYPKSALKDGIWDGYNN